MRLDAYDDYYRGRANLDSFQVDVVPEAAGRMSALEALVNAAIGLVVLIAMVFGVYGPGYNAADFIYVTF